MKALKNEKSLIADMSGNKQTFTAHYPFRYKISDYFLSYKINR